MTQKDLETKKKWLYMFILYFLFSVINSIRAIAIKPESFSPDTVTSMIFFNLLYAFLLYYCAYKKPGTKVLTVVLILVPVLNLSLLFAPMLGIPFQFDIWVGVAYLITVGFYLMNWKMRALNKRLKTEQEKVV